MKLTVESIRQYFLDYHVELPILRAVALRYRLIGPKTIKFMKNNGLLLDGTMADLSVRASNCLHSFGITGKAETKARIKNKTLTPHNKACRNYGWKTHCEVCAWVGLPKPERTKYVWLCPHCSKEIQIGKIKKVER